MKTNYPILNLFKGRLKLTSAGLISIIIIFALVFKGCVNEEVTGISYFNETKARYYFDKIEADCYKDGGSLWGRNIFGPLMFVDRQQRMVYSNFPDREGNLKKKEGIYSSSYPKDLIINRDSLTFGGTQFALAALPPEEDEFTIVSRGIRSLYYFHQHYFGYKPIPYNTSVMDEKNARLWLKLEWRALRKAIEGEGNERLVALRDALIFRGANHEFYSNYVEDQIIFENYEGLAVFTYLLLGTESEEEFKTKLLEGLDNIYSFSTYSGTYGSIHGAIYASFAYWGGFDFSTIKSANTDLGSLVRDIYDIQLPTYCRDVAGSIALNYDLAAVQAEEEARDNQIREQIKKETNIFTDRPVVSIDLLSPYFDYEPMDVVPVDEQGTIFKKLNVSDNWGKLMVEEGGCLVSNNFRNLKIPAGNLKTDRTHIYGDGWSLTLNSDWELVHMGEDYVVRRTSY
jgi:hypothetical protein